MPLFWLSFNRPHGAIHLALPIVIGSTGLLKSLLLPCIHPCTGYIGTAMYSPSRALVINMKQKLLLYSIFFLSGFTFSFEKSFAASITGFVWSDLNTNGIQDAGEPGLDTVWVFLLDASGNQVDGRLTDATGHYVFDNVADGTYTLRFANPGGLWQTLQDQGADDLVDSDADPFGYTAQFAIAGNQELAFDAGFTIVPQGCFTPVTITVSAIDCDDNGTPDPSDDTFTFAITATGGTGPWGWDMLPGISMVPYGTSHTFGPFQIVNGAVTLTINDHDNPDCTATVTVAPPVPCSAPNTSDVCDVKIIGCMKYELLGIALDPDKNRTYSIRVTNNCSNKMIYTAFQLPDGVVALEPANNSIYEAPSGREYTVRNPNDAPFYSIRFKSGTDSISNGASDIFEYTLPAQSAPDYIHVVSRVYPKIFYEAHLNTFNCVATPANSTQSKYGKPFSATNVEDAGNREVPDGGFTSTDAAPFSVYPNPSEGLLYADISGWRGQNVSIVLLSGQGSPLETFTVEAGDQALRFDLKAELPGGLYFMEVIPATGAREVRKFLLVR